MSKALRFGSAISFAAVASIMAGCAAPQGHVATSFGGKANENVGLATRALAALNSNDIPAAIGFAERAVARTPNDAGFRALLGNAYFAAGRFQSAEAAYRDSLTLYSNQPRVVLKLALVEIALGKSGEALSFLEAAKEVIDPSDYGLAIALAGHPGDAIGVLEAAARDQNADSRVRQNLALAYALSGNWTNARAIAAQDIPADQVDSRIHQWMQLASPKRSSDQVAALVGVTPSVVDPGEPVQLALNKTDTRMAQATTAPSRRAPAALVAPKPREQQVAMVAPTSGEQQVAMVAPTAPVALVATSASIQQAAMEVAQASPRPALSEAAQAPKLAPAPRHLSKPVALASLAAPQAKRSAKAQLREASAPRGNSKAVVQLGSFSNPSSVLAAWNTASHRFGALHGYSPMSARFSSGKGTFYRLSVHGFENTNEALALCSSLRRAGGSCFVRNVAGDAPVQIALR